jgi:hypothetical protein
LLLEAVQDLLDLHGELQKGAIFPDPRPESQVLLGDKVAADASLYFLETLEVQQSASALSAGPAFLEALAKVNEEKAPLLATLLNAEPDSTSPESFLSKHSSVLTANEREMVLVDIRDRRRPVRALPASKRPLKEIIRADGIEVRGRAEDMQNKVSIEESNDGWLISIRVQSRPLRSWN